MTETIQSCRVTDTKDLISVLDLGPQCLTSVYPLPNDPDPSVSPLELVFANDADGCHLVQLRHNANTEEMYGTSYGYHSSISSTMVAHLRDKFDEVTSFVELKPGECVLDIGCNDGTFLNLYKPFGVRRFGVDPSSEKFRDHFQDDIAVEYDFFSEPVVRRMSGDEQFKVISSIAMFYDINDPLEFMRQVSVLLKTDGIWLVEVAYLPLMLSNLAYDQVMHEHLTYLALRQMDYMAERTGLRLLDISTNYINGGSLNIICGKQGGPYEPNQQKITSMLVAEEPLQHLETFQRFAARVKNHRDEVRLFLRLLKQAKKTVWGYGASTKGNVVMNYCGLDTNVLAAVCDKNPYKEGRRTPQTRIPIVSHQTMRDRKPDYLFVNIWHLRREVLLDEREYIMNGGTMIFSLPRLHLVNKDNYDRYLNASFDDLSYPL